MAHDEGEAGQEDARPQRRSYWRAVVISAVAVLGAAVAVPVVLESSETPATGRPAMMTVNTDQMSEMMRSGPMMQPGQTMPGGMMMSSGHMMAPAQMAEMMQSGQMMNPGAMMGQGR